jgi:hypothetical protein
MMSEIVSSLPQAIVEKTRKFLAALVAEEELSLQAVEEAVLEMLSEWSILSKLTAIH